MSIATAAASPHPPVAEAARPPRVRQQARDAVTLMVFSAVSSVGVAVLFLLLAVAARQA